MRHQRLVMRPGPGWKYLAAGVWEHCSGARISMGGVVRLPDKKTYRYLNTLEAGRLGRQLIRINGGNRKRGMMAWARNLVGEN